MLDFTAVRRKEMSYAELAVGLAVADLRRLTNEIIDYQLALLADCTDADGGDSALSGPQCPRCVC